MTASTVLSHRRSQGVLRIQGSSGRVKTTTNFLLDHLHCKFSIALTHQVWPPSSMPRWQCPGQVEHLPGKLQASIAALGRDSEQEKPVFRTGS